MEQETQQTLAIGIGFGIVAQMGISGFTASLFNNWAKLQPIHFTMAVFNFFTVLYQVTSVVLYSGMMEGAQCGVIGVIQNVVFHAMAVAFDAFLLHKTWIVSGYHVMVGYGAVFLVLNRVAWGLYDLVESGAVWDPVGLQCQVSQFALTGLVYSLVDLVIDVTCTIQSIYFCWDSMLVEQQAIQQIIVKDNVLRSVCIVAMNAMGMWVNYCVTNTFADQVFWVFQSWILVFALNAEVFWKEERARGHEKMVRASASTRKAAVGGARRSTIGGRSSLN
ncbi:hypothetical protein HDU98_002406 [Podochytrium sp. JEL0797]|nr:hypothetical protein HDU98_002406 [Podochytrium sp. JEL0797]